MYKGKAILNFPEEQGGTASKPSVVAGKGREGEERGMEKDESRKTGEEMVVEVEPEAETENGDAHPSAREKEKKVEDIPPQGEAQHRSHGMTHLRQICPQP